MPPIQANACDIHVGRASLRAQGKRSRCTPRTAREGPRGRGPRTAAADGEPQTEGPRRGHQAFLQPPFDHSPMVPIELQRYPIAIPSVGRRPWSRMRG